ncbi:unnamed protein product [Closterium sp. NIES-64]|nr:unnamed protein product [Closterium sp. NIES-64]
MADDEASFFEAISSLGPLSEAELSIPALHAAESSPNEFKIEEIDGLPWLPPLEPAPAAPASECSPEPTQACDREHVRHHEQDYSREQHSHYQRTEFLAGSPGDIEFSQAIDGPVARSAPRAVPQQFGTSGFRRGFLLSGSEPISVGSVPDQKIERAQAQGSDRQEEEAEEWKEWISLSTETHFQLQLSEDQDWFSERGTQEASGITDTSSFSGVIDSTASQSKGDYNEVQEAKSACLAVGMEGEGIWSDPLPVEGSAWEGGLRWGDSHAAVGDSRSKQCVTNAGDTIEGDAWTFDDAEGAGCDDEVLGSWVGEMDEGDGEVAEERSEEWEGGMGLGMGMGFESTWSRGASAFPPGAASAEFEPAETAEPAGPASDSAASVAGIAARQSAGRTNSTAGGAFGSAAPPAGGGDAGGGACWSAEEVKRIMASLEQQSQRVLLAQQRKQSRERGQLEQDGVGRWMGMGNGDDVGGRDVVDELAKGHAEVARREDGGGTFFDEAKELERDLVARWGRDGDRGACDEGSEWTQEGVKGERRDEGQGGARDDGDSARGGGEEEGRTFFDEVAGLQEELKGMEGVQGLTGLQELQGVAVEEGFVSSALEGSEPGRATSAITCSTCSGSIDTTGITSNGSKSTRSGFSFEGACSFSTGSGALEGQVGPQGVEQGRVHRGKAQLGSRGGAKGRLRGRGFKRGFLLGGEDRTGKEKGSGVLGESVVEGAWKEKDGGRASPVSGGSPGSIDSNVGGGGAAGAAAGVDAPVASPSHAPQAAHATPAASPTDEAQAVFARVHPLCMAVVDARGDHQQLPHAIKRLEEAIGHRDVPVGGLQACLEFILFPLLLVLSPPTLASTPSSSKPPASAAAGEGWASSTENDHAAGITPRGRQRVVEAALSCMHVALTRCAAAEAEAWVGTRGSQVVRVEALRAVRLLVDGAHTPAALAFFLPGILSGLSRAALAPFSPRSNEPLTRGAAADPSAVAEALLGLSQALVLVMGDAYDEDGHDEGKGEENEQGSERWETEEERALSMLQQMVGRMEGRKGEGRKGGEGEEDWLGEQGVGSEGELQGEKASGTAGTGEGAVILREVSVRRRCEEESNTPPTHAGTGVGRAGAGGAGKGGRGGDGRARGAGGGAGRGVMVLRVEMDEAWRRETGAKVLVLLHKVLPKMLHFPAPKVRCALVDMLGELLLRCPCSLSASRPLLLECVLLLASDHWPSVASSARRLLARAVITEHKPAPPSLPPVAAATGGAVPQKCIGTGCIEVANVALAEMVERHMASLATPAPPTSHFPPSSLPLHSPLLPSPTLSTVSPVASASHLQATTVSLRVLAAGVITAGRLPTAQHILDPAFSARLSTAISLHLPFAPGSPHTLESSPAPALALSPLLGSAVASGESPGVMPASPRVPSALRSAATGEESEEERWRRWLWVVLDQHDGQHNLNGSSDLRGATEPSVRVLQGALAVDATAPPLFWFCRFLRVLARLAAAADARDTADTGAGGVAGAPTTWQQPMGALPALFQPLLEGLREAVGRIGDERRRERRRARAKKKERVDVEGMGKGVEEGERGQAGRRQGKEEGGRRKVKGRRKDGKSDGEKQGAERREVEGRKEGEQDLLGQVSAVRAASSFLLALSEALAGISGGPWDPRRGGEGAEMGSGAVQVEERREEEEQRDQQLKAVAQRDDRWHVVIGPVVQSVLGELLNEDLWDLPVDVTQGGGRAVQSGGGGEWMGEEERRGMMRRLNENANLQAVSGEQRVKKGYWHGSGISLCTIFIFSYFPFALTFLFSPPPIRCSSYPSQQRSQLSANHTPQTPVPALVAANMDYAIATVCQGLSTLHCHPSAPRLLLAVMHLLPLVPPASATAAPAAPVLPAAPAVPGEYAGEAADSRLHQADASKRSGSSAVGSGGAAAAGSAVSVAATAASVLPSAFESMLPLIIHPIRSVLASLQITARLQHAPHIVTLVQVLRVLMSACAIATSAKRADAEAAASAAIAVLRREERARRKQLRKLRRAKEGCGGEEGRSRLDARSGLDKPYPHVSRVSPESHAAGLAASPAGIEARLAPQGSSSSSSLCGGSGSSGVADSGSARDSKSPADSAVRAFFTRRMQAAAAAVRGEGALSGTEAVEGKEEEGEMLGEGEREEEGNSSDEEWDNSGSDTESEGDDKEEAREEGNAAEQWSVRHVLSQLSDRTRVVAMHAQLAAACLEACGPLMASRDAELALLAADVAQTSVAAMSASDVAQRARANELEAVREVVRLRVKRAKTHLTALQDSGLGTGPAIGLESGLGGGLGSGLLDWLEDDVAGLQADLASLQDDVAAMHDTEDALKVADAVRDETNWLLPRVHMIWPHAVSGLTRSHPALIISSIHVITALSTTCDDAFMARKIREDSWPLMAALLLQGPPLPSYSSPSFSCSSPSTPFLASISSRRLTNPSPVDLTRLLTLRPVPDSGSVASPSLATEPATSNDSEVLMWIAEVAQSDRSREGGGVALRSVACDVIVVLMAVLAERRSGGEELIHAFRDGGNSSSSDLKPSMVKRAAEAAVSLGRAHKENVTTFLSHSSSAAAMAVPLVRTTSADSPLRAPASLIPDADCLDVPTVLVVLPDGSVRLYDTRRLTVCDVLCDYPSHALSCTTTGPVLQQQRVLNLNATYYLRRVSPPAAAAAAEALSASVVSVQNPDLQCAPFSAAHSPHDTGGCPKEALDSSFDAPGEETKMARSASARNLEQNRAQWEHVAERRTSSWDAADPEPRRHDVSDGIIRGNRINPILAELETLEDDGEVPPTPSTESGKSSSPTASARRTLMGKLVRFKLPIGRRSSSYDQASPVGFRTENTRVSPRTPRSTCPVIPKSPRFKPSGTAAANTSVQFELSDTDIACHGSWGDNLPKASGYSRGGEWVDVSCDVFTSDTRIVRRAVMLVKPAGTMSGGALVAQR